jgi:hypothetical protein
MRTQLRHLVAAALYPTKAYNLPAVCERYGLDSGSSDEAFSSKNLYVMSRLEKLSDEKVLGIARNVVKDFPDDKLQAAVELLDKDGHLVSDITRHHIAEGLDEFSLAGKRDLLELLRKHWTIDSISSVYEPFGTLADDIDRHVLRNDDWRNSEILERVGFLRVCWPLCAWTIRATIRGARPYGLRCLRRDPRRNAHGVCQMLYRHGWSVTL